MSRLRLGRVGRILVGVWIVGFFCGGTAPAQQDPRVAERFLQALREKGLHDLALDDIELLRGDSGIPAELKMELDYHKGRTLVDEASKTSDLARRRELLDRASSRLERFVQEHPENPLAREALIEIARRIYERGHLAVLVAGETQDAARKTEKLDEARAAFHEARQAFGRASERLQTEYQKYAGFIAKDDPRLEERDKVLALMLDALLKRAVTIYELGQTYPPNAPERNSALDEALKEFQEVQANYRTSFAGLTAQMWQAKCFEEQGKIGEAIGIYQQLLGQSDPRLRGLKRHVNYFYIVALAKRKQYALAADEAARWLQTYNQRDERRSPEGLGVLLELAKSLDAQIHDETPQNERKQSGARIAEALSQVVRYASPYKNEALELLKKYKPSVAMEAQELSRLSLDEAMSQAEEAIAAHEWERAAALLKAAIAKGDVRGEIDKINLARYNLAFTYYMDKKFYEANVLAEHLARRHPGWDRSAAASTIAREALIEAYNAYTQVNRTADLERFVDMAEYTAKTWPNREEGDDARIALGQVHLGRGEYDRAIEAFSSVRDQSSRKFEARNRLGAAHWVKSRALSRREDDASKTEAETEAAVAVETLKSVLKDREETGAPPGDSGYLNNAADLASILTESGKPDLALATLQPIVDKQTSKTGAAYARLMEAYLLAQINAGQVEPAIASMKAIEAAGAEGNRAQLYFKLGRLLEREIERLRERNDVEALENTRASFRSFLAALTENKTGQTYESLQWAAESLLTLEAGAEAEAVLRRVQAEFGDDPNFLNQPGATERVLRTKVKLAASLRVQGKFDEAASTLEEILSNEKYRRYVEPMMEKGMLLDAQAEAGEGSWTAARAHWQDVARRLGGIRPHPASYFEAWLHAAKATAKTKQTAQARQILTGVIRLNPAVGGPEMKKKYEDLLKELK